jgi:AcrR family transcriptional regulator
MAEISEIPGPKELSHSRTSKVVRTPWGDANGLRARKLKAGGHHSRAQTERNQRERLFAAVVAAAAEKGYEATAVADLVKLSGVSRSTYYEHFADKQACFLAAVDAMIGPALERLTDEPETLDERRGREAFGALVEAVVAQPAAARVCLVELYAAGPEAVATLDRIVDGLALAAERMFATMPEHRELPPEIVRAIVGGVQKAIQKRLLRGEESALPGLVPQLWEWALSIPPPPGPLRSDRQRPLRPRRFAARQASSPPTERVLRALAAEVCERGYHEATVAAIVGRARTSQRTFYESFADKEAALVAALDSSSAQMLAAALPAFRRAPDWPRSVRDTLEAMLRFAAEEPEYGRLGTVEMYAAGRRALEQREAVTESLEELLAAGFELAPEAPPLAPEATAGALYALLYDFVRENGPERLPELLPTANYLTLAPFLGAEDAYRVAVS